MGFILTMIGLCVLGVVLMIGAAFLRYWRENSVHKQAERERQLLEKARIDALIARPLRDFVENQKKHSRPHPPHTESIIPPPLEPSQSDRFLALDISQNQQTFFIQDDSGQIYGPTDLPTLRQWIHDHLLTPHFLVSQKMDGPWEPAIGVKEISSFFGSTPPPSGDSRRFMNLKIKQ